MSENSIEDYSKKLTTPMYKNKHKLSPKWPFTLIISGHSGCGETNLLLNLIIKCLHFNRLYVNARNLNEPYYEHFLEIDDYLRGSLGDKYYIYINVLNTLDDAVPLEDIESSKQNLVVSGDFIIEKDQSKISGYFTMGRKYNCSLKYLYQSYYNIP